VEAWAVGLFEGRARSIAFSGSGRDQDGATWQLAAIGEDAGDCVAARQSRASFRSSRLRFTVAVFTHRAIVPVAKA
jgi:hypothetical protein